MLLRRIVRTPDDHALALVRIVLGFVFFAHGAQKVLGWFGGNGLDATMNSFTHTLGIPAPLAALAILAEFLGGIGLVAGLLSRVAALGIGVEMIVALLLVHAPHGFFMNWSGNQKGEGFEYHLLAIAMAFLVVVRGAGAWSLDRGLDAWLTRSARFHTAPASLG